MTAVNWVLRERRVRASEIKARLTDGHTAQRKRWSLNRRMTPVKFKC